MTYEVIFEPVPAGNDAEFNVFSNPETVEMYLERQTYEIKCGTLVVNFGRAADAEGEFAERFHAEINEAQHVTVKTGAQVQTARLAAIKDQLNALGQLKSNAQNNGVALKLHDKELAAADKKAAQALDEKKKTEKKLEQQ